MNDVDCDRDHLVGIGHRGNRPLQNQRPSCPDDHVHDDDGVNYDETKNSFIQTGMIRIKDLPEYQNWPDSMAQAADHELADIRPVHWIDRLPSELVPSVGGHPNDPLEPVHNDLCDYDHD